MRYRVTDVVTCQPDFSASPPPPPPLRSADHKGQQRIELNLPSAPYLPIPLPEYDPTASGRNIKKIPRQYEVKLTSRAEETWMRNIFAFREREERVKRRKNGDEGQGEDDDDEENDDDGESLDDEEDDRDTQASVPNTPTADTPPSRYPPRKKTKISTAFAAKITNEAAVKPILSSMSGGAGEESTSSRGVSPALLAAGGETKPSSSFTPEYREILRRRKQEASRPKRTVQMLDDSDKGANNMLAAGLGSGLVRPGAGNRNTPSSFIVSNANKPSTTSSRAEKFARIPRNELLDLLFSCYERFTYWTLRALREETRQPETYLRETLSTIADQHKRGPYVGQWSLKPEYVQQRRDEEVRRQGEQVQAQAQAQAAASHQQQQGGGGAGEGDDGVDDDDDDEMEEVV